MIGNNRPEKQHALGVKLFVDQADPEAVLTVYTNDGRALKQQVDRLSARDASRVSVLEGVEVTPALMRTIDVLLHPASSESLPRVALEARSQSAWVVGFDVGDLADFCETRVPFGALPEISDSLRRACESVRQGKWPEPLTPMTVPEYADRLLALCGQP